MSFGQLFHRHESAEAIFEDVDSAILIQRHMHRKKGFHILDGDVFLQQLNKKYKKQGSGRRVSGGGGGEAKTRNRKKALLRFELVIAGMRVWSANH